MLLSPAEVHVEELVATLVLWLKLATEVTGALLIGLDIVLAGVRFLRSSLPPRVIDFDGVRLTLARFLALALEFQLGADILSTAVAPSWDEIGKLGAIAVIRTALKYFLSREMEERVAAPSGKSVPAPDRRGEVA